MSADPTTLWHADFNLAKVVEVECPDGTDFPNVDAHGVEISDQTHFRTEREAWANLESEAGAWIVMRANRLTEAQEEVVKRQAECGEASQKLAAVKTNKRSRADLRPD